MPVGSMESVGFSHGPVEPIGPAIGEVKDTAGIGDLAVLRLGVVFGVSLVVVDFLMNAKPSASLAGAVGAIVGRLVVPFAIQLSVFDFAAVFETADMAGNSWSTNSNSRGTFAQPASCGLSLLRTFPKLFSIRSVERSSFTDFLSKASITALFFLSFI